MSPTIPRSEPEASREGWLGQLKTCKHASRATWRKRWLCHKVTEQETVPSVAQSPSTAGFLDLVDTFDVWGWIFPGHRRTSLPLPVRCQEDPFPRCENQRCRQTSWPQDPCGGGRGAKSPLIQNFSKSVFCEKGHNRPLFQTKVQETLACARVCVCVCKCFYLKE